MFIVSMNSISTSVETILLIVTQGSALAQIKLCYIGFFLSYHFLGEIISGKNFPYGSFHVTVPQSVDEGVEEWGSQCVYEGDELILLGVVAGVRA